MRKFLTAITIVVALVVTAVPADARTKTPKVCLTALDDADRVDDLDDEHLANFRSFFQTLIDQIEVSYDTDAFIGTFTDAVDVLTARTEELNRRMGPRYDAYDRHASKCRSLA